jgi:GNAT superfamily N-acetyltransferase
VRATVEDADLCFGIGRAAAIAGFGDVFAPGRHPFPDDAIRADWLAALSNPEAETYLAFEHAEAVGVVSVCQGILQTLYVLPQHWNEGVGSALHDLALDRLRETNVEEARLWTLAENDRARAFYEKRGWGLTGRTRVVPFPPHPIDVEYACSTTPGQGDTGRRRGAASPRKRRNPPQGAGFDMRWRGLEPPRPNRVTRPSTLRVYQFRHQRGPATTQSRWFVPDSTRAWT